VLFHLKSDWVSNTKKVEDIQIFPMGIYLSSFDQQFRFYDILHGDGFAENCYSGQPAATSEKINLGLFRWDSSPELNNKKSWKTLSAFHLLLIQPYWTIGLEVTEFCTSAKLLKTEVDNTAVGRNKILKLRQI
jgi:hypothetical protein